MDGGFGLRISKDEFMGVVGSLYDGVTTELNYTSYQKCLNTWNEDMILMASNALQSNGLYVVSNSFYPYTKAMQYFISRKREGKVKFVINISVYSGCSQIPNMFVGSVVFSASPRSESRDLKEPYMPDVTDSPIKGMNKFVEWVIQEVRKMLGR